MKVQRLLSDRLLFLKEPILASYPFLGLQHYTSRSFIVNLENIVSGQITGDALWK